MERKTIEQIFQLKLKEIPVGTGSSSVVYEIDDDSLSERQVLKVIDIGEMAKKLCKKAGVENSTEEILRTVKEKQLELYQKELLHNEQLLYTKNSYFVRILEPYEYGSAEDEICIRAMRMPYYRTLEELLKEEPLQEDQVLRLGLHIAEALKVMHHEDLNAYYQSKDMALGRMYHMDIKPENIFCKKQEGHDTFMLGDFGISCSKEDQIIGRTKGYSAPEVYVREHDPGESSDIFSLGCVFYYCLCEPGRAEAAILKFWEDRCNGREVRRPKRCRKEFWTVICRATKLKSEERYQNAEELWEALFELIVSRDDLSFKEKVLLESWRYSKKTCLAAGLVYGMVKTIAHTQENKNDK